MPRALKKPLSGSARNDRDVNLGLLVRLMVRRAIPKFEIGIHALSFSLHFSNEANTILAFPHYFPFLFISITHHYVVSASAPKERVTRC